MSRSTALLASGGRRAERLAHAAERLLRAAADARLGFGLLLVAGAWNAAAAALPSAAASLASPGYLVLLALIGPVDSITLRPGEELRVGPVRLQLVGFDAYLTFLSRRDPAMPLLFAGAALLVACLAIALWLPRRRVTVRTVDGGLRLLLRGERFDQPDAELELLRERLMAAVGEGGA